MLSLTLRSRRGWSCLLLAAASALLACQPPAAPPAPPAAPSATPSAPAPTPPSAASTAEVTPASSGFAPMPPKPKPPPPEENPLATEADYGAGSSPVFRVAVGGAPIDGKPTALITIVWFGGYQDPFTQRAHNGALAQIRSTYGDLVRIVWKDAPLPFHKFSMPALKIAHQARKNKGDAGFWQAHRELLAIPGGLDEKKLRAAALKLGLRPGQIQDAFSPTGELPPTFAEDRKQIEALRVQGTPHFFVNGHSLVGAQPFETFQVLIDDEIMTARDALKEGAAPDKIYETLQKGSRIGVPRPSSPPGGRPPGPGP